jgi:polysaccharide export outer membrane protein
MTPEVVNVLAANTPRLSTVFGDRRGPTELRFGVGDVVTVTIFEASAGGLFIPNEAGVRPGNFITLPPQAVDSKGNISIPYAGSIRAAGRTPTEVQQAIVDALKNRAIEPQAIVAFTDQRAMSISVLGDAVGSIRFPFNPSGERILDAVARAGLKSPGYDLWVMLEREGKREIVPFGALIYEPANNIYVRPQDTIFIYREPQTFLAFGATGRQGQYNFDAWRISLAEATAKAGGLIDTQADPAAVFLYRGETRHVAELLGIDCSQFEGPIIPVIYDVNLRDPAGYFLATKFEMRNKDVIFISNAASVEASKFLNYIRLIVATANDPVNMALTVVTLKNAIHGAASAIVTTPVPISTPAPVVAPAAP